MSNKSFTRKSDEAVRAAVSSILTYDISDPRTRLVTVTGVKTSPDRSVATIYVSGDPAHYEDMLAGLESAKGRIRTLLGKALSWRVTPEIRFFVDDAIDEGERIGAALRDVPPTLRDVEEPSQAPADSQNE